MTNDAARVFSARLAHRAAQGFSGAALYERLAQDSELPLNFNSEDWAAIAGITPLSVKKRRTRNAGPNFIRISTKAVRYPRAAVCNYLAARYVRTAA